MTTRYTPGPLVARKLNGESFGVYQADSDNTDLVARLTKGTYYNRPISEVKATAELFASAPELYEACVAWMDAAKIENARERMSAALAAMSKARAAIAKAEGREVSRA